MLPPALANLMDTAARKLAIIRLEVRLQELYAERRRAVDEGFKWTPMVIDNQIQELERDIAQLRAANVKI